MAFFRDFNRAFKDASEASNNIADAFIDYKATEAGRAGGLQKTATESNYGKESPEGVYVGEGADGSMTNSEAASYGLYVPKEDAEAGTGVSRKYGLGTEPTKWQDKEFAPEQRRAAGTQSKADYYRSVGDDAKADALETSLWTKDQRVDQKKLTGLQLKEAVRKDKAGDYAEADSAAERAAEAASAEFLKTRAVDKDGNQRMLNGDDYTAALQQKADYLFKNGHTKAANLVMDDFSKRTMTQITLQTAQREKALGEAMQAYAASKDPNALKDFYNQFVPDGVKVTNITTDAKGNILVQREDMDGRKITTRPIAANEFMVGLNSFKNPQALYEFSQNEFKNNLESRKVAATESQARSSAVSANATAAIAAERVTASQEERKRTTDAMAEITKLMPAYNAIKDKRSPEAVAILSDAVLNSATKSGDASKLLAALKERSGSGRKAIGKIEKTDDGVLVFDTDNRLTEFLTPSGLSLPPGMKEATYDKQRQLAVDAGVEARLGRDGDTGERVLGFVGKDGKWKPSLEEAKAAKGESKTESKLPPTPAKAEGLVTRRPSAATPISTDGGKTWVLDVPKTIRDPSVSFYRQIPNPAYSTLGGKTFGSRKEAEAAANE